MPPPAAGPRCHHCGSPLQPGQPSRRDVCAGCGSDVRVCRNCSFYAVGAHNDCREPMAEHVADKQRANFCEYFALAAGGATSAHEERGDAARAALDALFRRG